MPPAQAMVQLSTKSTQHVHTSTELLTHSIHDLPVNFVGSCVGFVGSCVEYVASCVDCAEVLGGWDITKSSGELHGFEASCKDPDACVHPALAVVQLTTKATRHLHIPTAFLTQPIHDLLCELRRKLYGDC